MKTPDQEPRRRRQREADRAAALEVVLVPRPSEDEEAWQRLITVYEWLASIGEQDA